MKVDSIIFGTLKKSMQCYNTFTGNFRTLKKYPTNNIYQTAQPNNYFRSLLRLKMTYKGTLNYNNTYR